MKTLGADISSVSNLPRNFCLGEKKPEFTLEFLMNLP